MNLAGLLIRAVVGQRARLPRGALARAVSRTRAQLHPRHGQLHQRGRHTVSYDVLANTPYVGTLHRRSLAPGVRARAIRGGTVDLGRNTPAAVPLAIKRLRGCLRQCCHIRLMAAGHVIRSSSGGSGRGRGGAGLVSARRRL